MDPAQAVGLPWLFPILFLQLFSLSIQKNYNNRLQITETQTQSHKKPWNKSMITSKWSNDCWSNPNPKFQYPFFSFFHTAFSIYIWYVLYMIDLKGSLPFFERDLIVVWGCRTCTEIITRRSTTCSRWCWSETRPWERPSCWLVLPGTSSVRILRPLLVSSSRRRHSSSITRPSRRRYGTLLAKRGVSMPCLFFFFFLIKICIYGYVEIILLISIDIFFFVVLALSYKLGIENWIGLDQMCLVMDQVRCSKA